MFNIIVAMCKKSRGIGFKDKLPFKSSKDLKRFKKITIGSGNNSVIMGSKTWLSLPFLTRPLKYRENIELLVIEQINCIKMLNQRIASIS